jgi:D-sedoheptulose 7-phosphate isomerase
LKKENSFLNNYFNELQKIINPEKKTNEKIILFKKYCLKIKKNKKKIFIFGNGGSSSIASHFTTDMMVNNNIKVFNFSDANLLTCFANDFGYENIFSKIIEYYGSRGDLLILISSSGQSKNHLKAATKAKLKKFFKIITLTGFKKNNPLSKKGHINFWINSKKYNHVENSHQIILLSLIDLIKKN